MAGKKYDSEEDAMSAAIYNTEQGFPDDLSDLETDDLSLDFEEDVETEETEKSIREMNAKKYSLGYLPAYLEHNLNVLSKEFTQDKDITRYYETDNIGEVRKIKPERQTDAVNDFMYGDGNYEDPTYLGFNVLLITDESPLYNYDTSNLNRQSAYSFIKKYGEIEDIANRADLLYKFQNILKEIFLVSTDDVMKTKLSRRHYVENIEGLEKLTSKIVKYEEDMISITLSEDISLKTQYMIELYNNLVYDYKNKRNIIPENLLRFNMIIKIKDIRDFKINNKTHDNRERYLSYKLHDCNFIFTDSITHKPQLSMGGFGGVSYTTSNTVFKIKYKSISKVFKSELISDRTYKIDNQDIKQVSVSKKDKNIYSFIENKDNEKKERRKKVIKTKKPLSENDITTTNKKSDTNPILNNVTTSKSWLDKEKEKMLDKGKKGLINKFEVIRGELLGEIMHEIRSSGFPDRLGNVYSTNFRQLSLQNFGKELFNDVLDKAEDMMYDATSFNKLSQLKLKSKFGKVDNYSDTIESDLLKINKKNQ